MFRKNTQHQQLALISAISELPDKQRRRLNESWAGTFYKEFFCRIDEEAFAGMYSESYSRPNAPVNILVSLEVLKAGFGWSDEELYDHFMFDLQVRYAVGLDRLGEGDFDVRTVYNFRRRLSEYNAEHGVNLLERAFERITDEQIEKLQVRTGMQRMDSTQIASDIASMSRLQLLVEGVRRVIRVLSEEDKGRLKEVLAPYSEKSGKRYAYDVKGREAAQEHLKRVGEAMAVLLRELKGSYSEEPAYRVLERLFQEHFYEDEEGSRPKENKELSAGSLQSVDDQEATFRIKRGKKYKGFVANITETCDPENEVQLITKVQVASNNVDDTKLLAEVLPELKERTGVEVLYTDGGYGGKESDAALQEQQVELIQSAIRGQAPSSEKTHLSEFEIGLDSKGNPAEITCPRGQKVKVEKSKRSAAFVARFSAEVCGKCELFKDGKCPAIPGKRDKRHKLRFTQEKARAAIRRRRCKATREEEGNLRAAVEATVRSVKHPFRAGKLPMRGLYRVSNLIIGSAAMVNVRRINRYLEKVKRRGVQGGSLEAVGVAG